MSNASFMEKLLEGVEVEWKLLGQVAEIYGGLSGKNKADFENGNAKYISYKNIFGNIDVNFDRLDSVKVSASENQHEVKYGDVLFTGSSETADEAGMSSAVTTKFDGMVYLNSFSFGVRFNDDIQMTPEFSKYLFRSHFMRKEIAKTASGVTRFNVSKARFKKIEIPIPPSEVQSEIVRILDNFTELTAELTAELSVRKKQYNYYRDQLLTFDDGEVEWKTLGEVGEFIRGKRFVKTDMMAEGFPCIHYGEMYTHYNIWAKEAKSFISNELALKLRVANHGDVVIVAAGETIEDIGRGTAWLGDTGVVIHDACFFFKSTLNPKYVAYFTRTKFFHDQIKKHISSGKISAINANGLSKAKIPIPYPNDLDKSLAEQKRIVSILDKFDALTNSITEGLPREIGLRQQQYEYYRDMLLSFPKVESEA